MSAFYDAAMQAFTSGSINLGTGSGGDVIKARFCRASAYTFSAAHTSMTPVGAGVGTDPTLGTKALSNGTFDAADAVWSAVGAGAAIDQLVIYKFVTNDAGSTPIAFINGFSVTPNGGDITAVWQSTSPFIFLI